MDKNFILVLENDQEWQCLKSALSIYLFVTSCYDSLDEDYKIGFSFLERIGVCAFSKKRLDIEDF